MSDLFLSYSRDDQLVMEVIRDNLCKLGFNVWVDTEHFEHGTKQWEQAIKEAIHKTNMMLVLCSPSAKESQRVKDTISLAVPQEKTIVPVWIYGDDESDARLTEFGNVPCVDMRGRSNPKEGFGELITRLAAERFDLKMPVYEFETGTGQLANVPVINVSGDVGGHVIVIGRDVKGDVETAGEDITKTTQTLPSELAGPIQSQMKPLRAFVMRIFEKEVISCAIYGVATVLTLVLAIEVATILNTSPTAEIAFSGGPCEINFGGSRSFTLQNKNISSEDIVWNASDGTIYASDFGTKATYRANVTRGTQIVIITVGTEKDGTTYTLDSITCTIVYPVLPSSTVTPTLSPKVDTATPGDSAAITTLPPSQTITLTPVVLKRIIFVSRSAYHYDLFTIDLDTQEVKNLTESDFNDRQPAISPDGTQIAFSSNRSGNYEIYLTDWNGHEQTLLINDPDDDTYPTWSPDGKRIAFVSNRSGRPEIYIINVEEALAGGDVEIVQVTQNNLTEQYLSWAEAPDGIEYLVFHAMVFDGSSEIYRVEAKRNSEEEQLTLNSAHDRNPTFLSDGSGRILFESNRDGNYEIYIMDANGSSETRITQTSYDEHAPRWSKDGYQIVFFSYRETDSSEEIYVIDLDNPYVFLGDEVARRLTENDVGDLYPIWFSIEVSP